MTDDESIQRAAELCSQGSPALGSKSHAEAASQIEVPRLRTIVSVKDALEARCLVPALLEIIERRGLKEPLGLEVNGDSGSCLVDPRGGPLTAEAAAAERAWRDGRILAIEAIGGALSTLCRLDHVWCDEDVRETLTQARVSLARAQSKIKERIGA